MVVVIVAVAFDSCKVVCSSFAIERVVGQLYHLAYSYGYKSSITCRVDIQYRQISRSFVSNYACVLFFILVIKVSIHFDDLFEWNEMASACFYCFIFGTQSTHLDRCLIVWATVNLLQHSFKTHISWTWQMCYCVAAAAILFLFTWCFDIRAFFLDRRCTFCQLQIESSTSIFFIHCCCAYCGCVYCVFFYTNFGYNLTMRQYAPVCYIWVDKLFSSL